MSLFTIYFIFSKPTVTGFRLCRLEPEVSGSSDDANPNVAEAKVCLRKPQLRRVVFK